MSENEVVTTEAAPEAQDNPTDSLSGRDALARAISENRESPKETAAPEEAVPTQKEVKQAVEADIEPPAEFSAAGKEAWKSKDLSGIQREYRRIHDSRTQELTRTQNEARRLAEESKTYKELAKTIAPYIEARGAEGTTPEKALMEAVALVQELKKNPKAARAELEKLGFDFTDDGSGKKTQAENSALQERLLALEEREKARVVSSTVEQFNSSYSKLIAEKTRTGELRFPDLVDESEKGIELGREIGSLTSDASFRKGVLRRIPDATHVDFVREAYKYAGGRVVDESVRVSKDTQQDIQKKRRAAASSPGRISPSNGGEALKGKLSGRAAIARAIEEQREH